MLDDDEDNEGDPAHADELHDSGPSQQQQQSPQEYRRKEMEDHASSGRPIIREPRLSTSFVRRLLLARGSQLQKLRIHGILTALDQLRTICETCSGLQDLVVQLFEDDKVRASLFAVSATRLPLTSDIT